MLAPARNFSYTYYKGVIMALSREGNTGGLPVSVAQLSYAAGNFAQKYGGAVVANALATALVSYPAMATATVKTDILDRIKSPTPHVAEPTVPGTPRDHNRPRRRHISYRQDCTSTGHMFGRDKKQIIMNYFVICQGDSVAQAAGIEGNLMQESGLQTEEIETGGYSNDPTASGGGGWGLAQWTPGSTAASESRKYGLRGPIYTLQTQLALISAEMKGSSPTGQQDMLRMLKQTRDPNHAAESFEQYFEEGSVAAIGGGQLSNRQEYARQVAHQYGATAIRALHTYRNNTTRSTVSPTRISSSLPTTKSKIAAK